MHESSKKIYYRIERRSFPMPMLARASYLKIYYRIESYSLGVGEKDWVRRSTIELKEVLEDLGKYLELELEDLL